MEPETGESAKINGDALIADADPRIQRCGFARLLGDDLDYIVRSYEIILGRRSKASSADVVLGDHMSVSRQHACIFYNFHTRQWFLDVLGKNGVAVNGVNYLPGCSSIVLATQAHIQIGQDVSFYFLLPKPALARRPTVPPVVKVPPPSATAANAGPPRLIHESYIRAPSQEKPEPGVPLVQYLAQPPPVAERGRDHPVGLPRAAGEMRSGNASPSPLGPASADPGAASAAPSAFQRSSQHAGISGGLGLATAGGPAPREATSPRSDAAYHEAADAARAVQPAQGFVSNMQDLAASNQTLLQSLVAHARSQAGPTWSGDSQGASPATATGTPTTAPATNLTAQQLHALHLLRQQQQQLPSFR